MRPLDLSGVEFVVPDKTGIDDADAAVAANLEAAMKRLAAAGAKVTSRPVPRSAPCAPSPRNTARWSRSKPMPNIARSLIPLTRSAWIAAW